MFHNSEMSQVAPLPVLERLAEVTGSDLSAPTRQWCWALGRMLTHLAWCSAVQFVLYIILYRMPARATGWGDHSIWNQCWRQILAVFGPYVFRRTKLSQPPFFASTSRELTDFGGSALALGRTATVAGYLGGGTVVFFVGRWIVGIGYPKQIKQLVVVGTILFLVMIIDP